MNPSEVPDDIVMTVCERYLSAPRRGGVARVADDLNRYWRRQGIGFSITREQVYPLLNEGRERNFFSFSPPLSASLSRRIAERYAVPPANVRVVSARDSLERVAETTAELAMELIHELGHSKGKRHRVHVGLGAGNTTRIIVRHMAKLLRSEVEVPRLTLHAMTSGFDVTRPWAAPVSFFTMFDAPGLDIEYVGLFAPAFVHSRQYQTIKSGPGVKDSFTAARQIDLVITSLASGSDEHSDLMRFMTLGGKRKDGVARLRRRDWVGDVQYRPYSHRAPITADVGLRAVTLFEIEDLVRLARRPSKHLVLVAGPCGECGRTRADALRPLLEQERLRAWTHLVMDIPTAGDLLEPPRTLGRRRRRLARRA